MADLMVLDSYALIAFFEDEHGAGQVHDLLIKAEKSGEKLLMSVINLGEVWYSIAQGYSERTADEKLREIHEMSIEIVNADWALTRRAASFKARGKIAYADCFAAALACERRAKLVTGNPEFKLLEDEVKIFWIRT
ncbi:MAG: type II toxin-antitoxin system VapC family toxin [Syntrophobacteraceae bacterium]